MKARLITLDRDETSAALTVADFAARQHPCELSKAAGITICGHPDHARDAASTETMLTVLGLVDDDLPHYLVGPVPTAPELIQKPKRCRACQDWKPVAEFPLGRHVCKRCHEAQKSESQRRRREAARAAAGPVERKRKPRSRPDDKRCSRCRDVKSAADFYREARNADGLRSECKQCFETGRKTVAA